MSRFTDTSFLYALYIPQSNSVRATTYCHGMKEVLVVSSLLLFEFRQSIRLQVFRHREDPTQGFPKQAGDKALRALAGNLEVGALVLTSVDWADVHDRAERLSANHTSTEGHRALDVLHVATALHLDAKEFLTFDGRQKKLAQAEGLKVPL